MYGVWQLIRDTTVVAVVTAMVNAVVPRLAGKASTWMNKGRKLVFSVSYEVEDSRVPLTAANVRDVVREADALPNFENQAHIDWLERLKVAVNNTENHRVLMEGNDHKRMKLKQKSPVNPNNTNNKALPLTGQYPQIITPKLEEASQKLVLIKSTSAELEESHDQLIRVAVKKAAAERVLEGKIDEIRMDKLKIKKVVNPITNKAPPFIVQMAPKLERKMLTRRSSI